MKKRLLSLFLSITIVTGTFVFSSVQADTDVVSPNIAILEAILNGNRGYVIDTIINDDLSTNPHAKVNYISSEKSMMQTVLSQYSNTNDPNYSWIYKLAVDTMIALCSVDDYTNDIANTVTELSADALAELGGESAATSFLTDCVHSSKAIHYDNILQEVLSNDYKSSTGISISGSDSQLTNLRRIYDAVDGLNNLNSHIKNLSGLDQNTAETTTQYLNNILIPAANSYEDVVKSFAKISDTDIDTNGQAMLDFTKALSVAVMYDSNVISTNNAGEKITTIAPLYLLDDTTVELIDLNSNLSDFALNSLDSYMYIKAIQTQKQAIAGPLRRTADIIGQADSANVVRNYAKLIENASDKKTANYQWVIKMLREKGIVEGFVEDKLSVGMNKLAERLIPLYNESIIPSTLTNLTGVVSTTINLGDTVTGSKNTALKTLELKELNELINYFKKTYNSDLQNYKSSPTDENAAKVLDDIAFIQRMRLRGETIAYKMTINQITSPLGKLLSGGYDSSEYYTKHYQYHIDAIIGASVMPISTGSIDVSSGTTVTIWNSPDVGTCAEVKNSSGSTYNIAEIGYRLPNGIKISSGGSLKVYSGDILAIPYITNSGGDVFVGNNSPIIGEYIQNSGTLTISGVADKYIDDFYLQGGTVTSSEPVNIISNNITSSGNVTVTNANVNVKTNAKFGGTLAANVNCFGSILGNNGTITSLNLCGNSTQNIEGTLNTTNLTYSNSGNVNQIGAIYVSGALKNTSSKVINGKNTVLKSTGYINGDYYNGSLTLDGTTLSSYKKFGESLYTQGTVNLSDIDVTAIFCQNSGTLNLNGNVTVGDDVSFSGTVTQANDKTFNLKGDLSASSATLGNLNICGKLGQTINSPITVNDFSNNNNSKNGLTLNGTVTVNGQVSSIKAPTNGKNIVLTNTASFKDNTYYGDITINGLSGSLPATLNGKLYLNGEIEQSTNSTVTGDIEILSGTLNIKNANFTANKKLTFSGGTVNLENSDLTIKSILNTASGTSVNIDENSLLYLKTDSVNGGTISGEGNLEIYGDFQNNGTVNIKNLKITAKLPVTISGNNITANTFSTIGNSTITLDNKINVLDNYTNNGAKVNSGNIVFSSGNNVASDVKYGENMNVTGDLVIDGFTVTVVQNAEITGNIVITNGGKLNIGKNLILKNGNITLSDNSLMTVGGKTDITASNSNAMLIDSSSEVVLKKLAIISGMGNITTDGKLSFGSDTSLSSVNLNGGGTVSLKGDLILSSSTVNYPNAFLLNGKAPQILSGGTMNFNNITIDNPSRSGVTFSSSASYKGEYINNNSSVSGTLNKQ